MQFLSGIIDRSAEKIWSIAETRANPWVRQIAYLLMLTIFISGTLWAVHSEPDLLEQMKWGWVAGVLALGVPLTIGINIARYVVLGKGLGKAVSFRNAVVVIVAGRLASILPLPGGLLIRAAGHSNRGQQYTTALSANLISSVMWLGMAMVYAGAAATIANHTAFGASLFVLGSLATWVTLSQLRKLAPNHAVLLTLSALNVAQLVMATVRLWMCLHALNYDADLLLSAVLSLSGPIGVAVGIAPDGIGVTEGAASLVAYQMGMVAHYGFLAAALNRIVAYIGMLPLVIWLIIERRRPSSN